MPMSMIFTGWRSEGEQVHGLSDQMMPRIIRLVAILSLCLATAAPAAPQAIPAQFMAKIYSEALGRLPDKTGWLAMLATFTKQGCSVKTLSDHARGVLLSAEFAAADYPDDARALLAYRTILDREPVAGDMGEALAKIAAPGGFGAFVSTLLSGVEFAQLAKRACAGKPYYFNMLGKGGYALPMASRGMWTQDELQAKLNAAKKGETVALPPMLLVPLTRTLLVPEGVTLTTQTVEGKGAFKPARHGLMARLVRDKNFTGDLPVIRVLPGATLTGVWVDGQRGAEGVVDGQAKPFVHSQINIQTLSGTGTRITDNFIANTVGWSSLQITGSAEVPGTACAANVVTGNMITVYASNHSDRKAMGWADGISMSCEDAHVAGNQIVDATDVGIVLFRSQIPGAGAPQRSIVENNLILNAGNSAFGALAVDPLFIKGGCAVRPSFRGAALRNNRFWAGPGAGLSIGIAVGTAPWFSHMGGCLGEGVAVTGNSTDGIATRMNNGIAIQGMMDALVADNALRIELIRKGKCRQAAMVAGVKEKIASGQLPPYEDHALKHCI